MSIQASRQGIMKAMTSTMAALSLVSVGCGDDDDDDGATAAAPERVVAVTAIVADQPGAAMMTDATLVNAWGLAFNPDGVAWVSATESGLTKVYDANGTELSPPVAMPSAEETVRSAPTGQVFNEDSGAFMGDDFIFVTEDGIISGWQQVMGGQAVPRVDNSASGASYKGVTIARGPGGQPQLFAADFRGGKIDVFDASYAPIESPGFLDPELPSGFAPFNIEEVNGALMVTYALQDENREDDVAGAGNGFVDLFNADGSLMARLISQGDLNSPWGIAVSPASFEAAPNRLLIGNFGDGRILVYTFNMSGGAASAVLEGTLRDNAGNDLLIDGLWALKFPPNAGGFSSSQLYYTAGPAEETRGVFGRIETGVAATSASTAAE